MVDIPVVTVDGPGGAGKGTLCSRLAARLGWHILDSGCLYRALAYAVQQAGVATDDGPVLQELAGRLEPGFDRAAPGSAVRVLLDGEDLGPALRTEEYGRMASVIAACPAVREALLARQRAFLRPPGLAADGRDMGTVVFPRARLKVFLTASAQERAARRHNQLRQKEINDSLRRLSATMAERDARDAGRAAAPLRPAEDALIIDTTGMSAGAVWQRVSDRVGAVWPSLAARLGADAE